VNRGVSVPEILPAEARNDILKLLRSITPTRARRPFDASVDPTEARNDILSCFGRSHRSRLIPGDDITPDERGVMVRNAAQFGLGVGPGQR
jgi:hypothetical protein